MTPNKSDQKKATVLTVETPEELLEFLLRSLKGKSRNNVKSLLTRKVVSVNGKVVSRHDYQLTPGQLVRIAQPGEEAAKLPKGLTILFENDELLAIDKPAGLLTIANENEKIRTAYHMMTAYYQTKHPKSRLFVVHRLDRDTSGVVIFAKNERIKHALQDNWNNLVESRGYTAVAEGVFTEKSGTVRSWLLETKTHMMYSSSTPGDGLEAMTDYRVLREGSSYSLLDVNIRTGRKNQIRVHMKDLGHPVAGDKMYGATTNPLGRLCLHAGTLSLMHPLSGELMVFESKIPSGFLRLFENK